MKKNRQIKNFILSAIFLLGISSSPILAQIEIDHGTGMEWSEPSTNLILNENFQDFDHFYSKPNPNSGSSAGVINPELDPEDPNYITFGYKDMVVQKKLIGNPNHVTYDFYWCAFAPDWMTAYAFRDEENDTGSGANTPGVSNGFVEISREWPDDFNIPGYFEIDLSSIPYIELIQYTHSSTGGNKRGFLLEFTLDGGENWDTLRYESGNPSTSFFIEDIFAPEEKNITNPYNCQPSAYGMTWEDALYFTPDEEYDDHLKIRFSHAGNQALRIHDLRIYGEFPVNIKENIANELDLNYSYNSNMVTTNELTDITIYSLTGTVVKQASNTDKLSLQELPNGIYIVNAQTGYKTSVIKINK